MSSTATVADAPQRGFFGHPRGLSTLFFTEMWERFSYYGMRAILGYYLYTAVAEGGLGIPESTALSVVGVYGASVYMSGIFGGWFADRIIGAQWAVFYGGLVIMLGHICLAMPGGVATVVGGLVLLVIGTGLLKPNISGMLGSLYGEHDTRRDAGFSIFYMGINIGGFLAPLVCGWLGEKVNWHLGFGAAAVGMALGLIQYVIGRRNLGTAGLKPVNPLPAEHKGRVLGRAVAIAVLVVGGIAVLGFSGVIGLDGMVNLISLLSAVLPVVYFAVMLSSKQITRIERDRLVAYIPLFLATALFFLLFEQQPNTLANLAEADTQLGVLGYEIPASWFQSINSLAIIALAPVFATLWIKLGERQPSTPQKFVGGLLFVGLAFLWVVLSKSAAGDGGKHMALMLAMVFVIMTIGELMLSPVGLSASTKLAPKVFASQTLGLYFLAPAMGQGLGAQVVKLYSVENQQLYFGIVGLATIGCAVLLAVGAKSIKKYMHGVN
ncbi:POT family proton-dependent oligopeptide transporter [Saccharopolyspora erythraea NRRL 2338]|uniref:Di-tripeptide ABC transporter (Permease) n=1 Tax=Saccharopolyspora erythraea (strain ATCC 11635 / DSM 40517 / JCM 4748 / NBRC 13426 / NCIMB 8594 / NRRL 2338) TaxID=405948 RepID=A4FGC6_SACEN|nr:peptide MFS transporter [Saccharopolyspora erythraea]PFG96805.1 POT family proton-dependent oligopeptide transporter [Saccharopolyspora erythraea NRRL 2338]QRK87046.1 peptide MFS transporter [Saccharopolyspora erythraea]CAM03101.1 di-tripeptide ABC transporter (permease) [Saccharopolyspora erythraea NRRL 2338]